MPLTMGERKGKGWIPETQETDGSVGIPYLHLCHQQVFPNFMSSLQDSQGFSGNPLTRADLLTQLSSSLHSATSSVICAPAAASSSLLDMQTLRPHPRHNESDCALELDPG